MKRSSTIGSENATTTPRDNRDDGLQAPTEEVGEDDGHLDLLGWLQRLTGAKTDGLPLHSSRKLQRPDQRRPYPRPQWRKTPPDGWTLNAAQELVDADGKKVGGRDDTGHLVNHDGYRLGQADGHDVLGGRPYDDLNAIHLLYEYWRSDDGHDRIVGRFDPAAVIAQGTARAQIEAARSAVEAAQDRDRSAIPSAESRYREAVEKAHKMAGEIPQPVQLIGDGRYVPDRLVCKESNIRIGEDIYDAYDGIVDGELTVVLRRPLRDERTWGQQLSDTVYGEDDEAKQRRERRLPFRLQKRDASGNRIAGEVLVNHPKGSARFARISPPTSAEPGMPSPEGFTWLRDTFHFAPARGPVFADENSLLTRSTIPPSYDRTQHLAYQAGLRQIVSEAAIEYFVPIRIGNNPNLDGAERPTGTQLRYCRFQPELRDSFAGHILIHDPDEQSPWEPEQVGSLADGAFERKPYSIASAQSHLPDIAVEDIETVSPFAPSRTRKAAEPSNFKHFRSSSGEVPPFSIPPRTSLEHADHETPRPIVPPSSDRRDEHLIKGPEVRYDPVSGRWLAPSYHAEIQRQYRKGAIKARTEAEMERLAGKTLSETEKTLCATIADATEHAIERWLKGSIGKEELESLIIQHDSDLRSQLNAAMKDRKLANIFQYNAVSQYTAILSLGITINNLYQFYLAYRNNGDQ